jgi:hypothetical protein
MRLRRFFAFNEEGNCSGKLPVTDRMSLERSLYSIVLQKKMTVPPKGKLRLMALVEMSCQRPQER